MVLTTSREQSQAEPRLRGGLVAAAPQGHRFLLLACELVVLAFVAVDLWQHAMAIRQHAVLPYQADYEEGNILNALLRIVHGQTPYPDPHAIPNLLSPYGPLAYYLLSLPARLFGLSFLGPRLMIAGSVAVICCLLGLTVSRLSGSRLAGILFGAMYGALALVQGWSAVLRVDLLALAFVVAGVWAFSRGLVAEDAGKKEKNLFSIVDRRSQISPDAGRVSEIDQESKIANDIVLDSSVPSASSATRPRLPQTRRWLLISALLFAAALLVKHTYVAAPLACVAWLLLRKQWAAALRFAAIVSVVGAGVLAIGAAATGGALLTHLFLTHADPFSWSVYLLRLTDIVGRHRVLMALAALLLVSDLLRRRISLPALWLVLAAATAVTAGKLGSNWNHFLELPAALCLCAGIAWARLAQVRPRLLATAALLGATAWLALFAYQQRKLTYDSFLALEECPQAYAYVQQHGRDRVLSENVGALVMAGKTVWFSNLFVYSQQVMRGGWPDAGLDRMLRAREFDLLVTRTNYAQYPALLHDGDERFAPAALQAMVENYQAVQWFRCRDAAVMWEQKSGR